MKRYVVASKQITDASKNTTKTTQPFFLEASNKNLKTFHITTAGSANNGKHYRVVCVDPMITYCICIMMRGRIYSETWPEHKENPEGGAGGISQGLRLYFTIYPHSSDYTDIVNI